MNKCKDIKIIKTSPTDWYKLTRIKICENQCNCNLWEGNNKIALYVISRQPFPNRNHLNFVSIFLYDFIFMVCDYE